MVSRRFEVEVFDDGVSACLNLHRYDFVGGVEVGPIPVICHLHQMSFPAPTDQWVKDMLVQVIEHL